MECDGKKFIAVDPSYAGKLYRGKKSGFLYCRINEKKYLNVKKNKVTSVLDNDLMDYNQTDLSKLKELLKIYDVSEKINEEILKAKNQDLFEEDKEPRKFEIKNGVMSSDEDIINLRHVERINYEGSSKIINIHFSSAMIKRIVSVDEFKDIKKEFHSLSRTIY